MVIEWVDMKDFQLDRHSVVCEVDATVDEQVGSLENSFFVKKGDMMAALKGYVKVFCSAELMAE
jgi:hypothetical protein